MVRISGSTSFVTVALFLVQRALGVGRVVSLVTTFLLATAEFIDIWPYQALFVTGILLVGTTWAVRADSSSRATGRLLTTMLLGAFVRPDLVFAFLVSAFLAGRSALRRLRAGQPRWREWLLAVWPVALLGVTLLLVFGNPVNTDRAFYAWGQHYACNASRRGEFTADPWANWFSAVVRDFGNVDSVGGAALANPAAFARNLWANVCLLPDMAPRPLMPALLLGTTASRALNWLYFLGLLWGLAVSVRAMRKRLGQWRSLRLALTATSAVAMTTLVDVVLVFPREHYFLPLVGLSVACAAPGLEASGDWLRRAFGKARGGLSRAGSLRRRVVQAGALVAVLLATPNRARGLCVQSMLRPPAAVERPSRETLQVAGALSRLHVRGHVVAIEPNYGYLLYSGVDAARVSEWLKNRPFASYVRENDISLIVLPEDFGRYVAFADDPEYKAFLVHPEALGFRLSPVPGSTKHIAVRSDVLGE